MAEPTYMSEVSPSVSTLRADMGAQLLGLPLFEQGHNVARVLDAEKPDGTPLFRTVGVQIPRRGTKTTSIWAVILGRMVTIPNYNVVTTAQDGVRARQRFMEVARLLESKPKPPWCPSFSIKRGAGHEALEFSNGSRLWVVKPDATAFRGEAGDCLLFDEAGELSVERSDDLLAGALPIMDTRPHGQVIIAGTPGKVRAGLLWNTLDSGRKDQPGVGIVDYSIRDNESSVLIDEDGNETLDLDMVRRVHPGVDSLTPIEIIEQRFEKMQRPQFEAEYLCRWPLDVSVYALDPAKWADSARPFEDRPERVGLAYDCAPDGSTAAVMAAWRTPDGEARLEVVAYRPGVSWVARFVHRIASERRTSVAYDVIGANTNPAEELHRLKPSVKTDPLTLKEVQGAAQRIASALEDGGLGHFDQPDLNAAVDGATWRNVGESGRAFGRKTSKNDVSPIVAGSLALWSYDKSMREARTLELIAPSV